MSDPRVETIAAVLAWADNYMPGASDDKPESALNSITRELSLARAVVSGAESYAREGLTAALFAYRAEFPKEQA